MYLTVNFGVLTIWSFLQQYYPSLCLFVESDLSYKLYDAFRCDGFSNLVRESSSVHLFLGGGALTSMTRTKYRYDRRI
jgi:hypothetical protein